MVDHFRVCWKLNKAVDEVIFESTNHVGDRCSEKPEFRKLRSLLRRNERFWYRWPHALTMLLCARRLQKTLAIELWFTVFVDFFSLML